MPTAINGQLLFLCSPLPFRDDVDERLWEMDLPAISWDPGQRVTIDSFEPLFALSGGDTGDTCVSPSPLRGPSPAEDSFTRGFGIETGYDIAEVARPWLACVCESYAK